MQIEGAAILFVEDQDSLRELASDALSMEGAVVVAAADGRTAIEALRHGPQFDAVVSDVFMPGNVTGVDVAEAAQTFQPQARVVLTSGSAAHELPPLPADVRFLAKPYRMSQMLALICQAN